MKSLEIALHIQICEAILDQLDQEIEDIKLNHPIENHARWVRLSLITKRKIKLKEQLDILKTLWAGK